jgi:hypothetical protein
MLRDAQVAVFSNRAEGPPYKCAQSKKQKGFRGATMTHESVPDIAGPPQEECTMAEAALGRMTPERLTVGDGRPLLVADFQPFSSAPRLSTLISGCAHGHPVFRLDPLAALSAGGYRPLDACAADFAGQYAAAADDRPVTVVGYCTAPALALRVGARLARTREVRAVLVRPEWPDTAWLVEQFAAFREDLGARPGPTPSLDGGEAQVIDAMTDVLRGDLAALAERRGLGAIPGALDELLAGYRGWLGFLLACAADPAAPPPAAAALDIRVLTDPAGGGAELPPPWPSASRIERSPWAAPGTPASAELAALVLALGEDH